MPRTLTTLALLFLAWLAPTAAGQAPSKPPQLGAESIAAATAAAQGDTRLTDGERNEALNSYSKAVEAVALGDAASTRAQELLAAKARAPERLLALREELAKPQPNAVPAPPEGATLADIEQSAAGAEEAAREAAAALEAVKARMATRSQQQPQLPRRIAEARERLATATAEHEAATKQEGDGAGLAARRTELLAQVYAAAQRLFELESTLASYEGSEELLTAERDLNERQSQRAATLAKRWKDLVQARRLADAQAAQASAAAAAEAAEDRHPLVLQLAQQNEVLASRRSKLAEEFAATNRAVEFASTQLTELDEDFQDVAKRVKAVRLTDALGALLRDRRSTLPDRRKVRGRIASVRDQIAALQLERVELDDERRTLKRDEHRLDVLAGIEFRPADARAGVRREVSDLLLSRLAAVEVLRSETAKLFDALIRLDDDERRLLAKIDEYVDFLNARVLWARSTTPIWNPRLDDIVAATGWLASPANWWSLAANLGEDLRDNPTPVVLSLLLILASLFSQRRLRRSLRTQGEAAARNWALDFAPTAWSLLLTALVALPLPMILWVVGWRLDATSAPTDFARSIGLALQNGALLLLALTGLRQIVRSHGLAEAHFAWAPQTLRLFRTGLLWLSPLTVVATIVLSALEHQGEAHWKEALGRPVLLLTLAGLAFFFARLLHPRHGVASARRGPTSSGGWTNRLRLLWLILGVGIPGLLFVLGMLGFHFTALQLTLRLGATVGTVLAVFLLNDVILRALVLARRKLAMQQAAERRKAVAAAKATDQPEPAKPTAADEPLIDATSVAEQTRSLVRSLAMLCVVIGVWVIWVDVLPALGVFQDVLLWENIALSDAMLSTIVFVMTFLAARNIPGVLQLTLLQRLRIHEGERHAITTIARYAIILIGAGYGFSTLGLGWGKLQWLAAGISVGLGFGLQEIFANFISGLIILFERPVRVGDLVTVNGIDGYVTRIQMRATTIRDYNRKELVIPNKEFITGSIVNWTLSDSVTRLIIKVGVAYGSDTELCRDLLLKVAARDRNVLDQPKPKALFLSFGESSLDFQLRVFTINVDVWPEVIDGLHRNIDAEFQAAGIEIAFPQRDLHIRSAQPIVAAVQQPGPGEQHKPAAPSSPS